MERKHITLKTFLWPNTVNHSAAELSDDASEQVFWCWANKFFHQVLKIPKVPSWTFHSRASQKKKSRELRSGDREVQTKPVFLDINLLGNRFFNQSIEMRDVCAELSLWRFLIVSFCFHIFTKAWIVWRPPLCLSVFIISSTVKTSCSSVSRAISSGCDGVLQLLFVSCFGVSWIHAK